MPLGPIGAGLIMTGVNALGNLFNVGSQAKQNEKNRQHALEMYRMQRADSVADRDFENAYNSPAEQMRRLKEAGLNPHLVYGNGADAGGTHINQSSPPAYKGEAPQIDTAGVVGGISAMYDFRLKDAQASMLKEQAKMAVMEQAVKAAQVGQIVAGTETTHFDLSQKKRLADTSFEAAQANLQKVIAETDKTKVDTVYTLRQDERAAAQNAVSVKKAIEEILTLRLQRAKTNAEIQHIKAQIQYLNTQDAEKKYDLHRKRSEISPTNFMDLIGNYFNDRSKVERVKSEAKRARDSWHKEDTMNYRKYYHLD